MAAKANNGGNHGLVVKTDGGQAEILSGGKVIGVPNRTKMSSEKLHNMLPAGVICTWNPKLDFGHPAS